MPFIMYNPNPYGRRVDDCTVRAASKALNQSWEETFVGLSMQAFADGDIMDAKANMCAYLQSKGFRRFAIPNTCPACYTVAQFAQDHPHGTFVLGGGDHVVAVVGGDWFDTFDSRDMVPLYVWVKGER